MRAPLARFFVGLALMTAAAWSSAAATFTEMIIEPAKRLARETFDLFKPDAPRVAGASFAMVTNIGGTPVDPTLLQSMRHESRSAVIGADRKH